MSWIGWLLLITTAASLYLLGLVLYRLALNSKALRAEIEKSQQLIAEARSFEKLAIEPATASTQAELSKLIRSRRAFVRSRAKKAEDEQRRLVQRVRDIEIDKR